jgi:hypothetical protein
MEDQGAPAPPRLDHEDGPPEPPSEEERDQIDDAFEACKDKLPEDVRRAGPPFAHPCGPPGIPPGAEPGDREDQQEAPGQDDD